MEERIDGEFLSADSMTSTLEMADDLNHPCLVGAITIAELEEALSED